MQIEEAIEILRKDILIDDCFINHELDVIFKESTKIAIETVLNELEKKDTVINEAISYIENTFELEDEKCITELYDILKKAEEK